MNVLHSWANLLHVSCRPKKNLRMVVVQYKNYAEVTFRWCLHVSLRSKWISVCCANYITVSQELSRIQTEVKKLGQQFLLNGW